MTDKVYISPDKLRLQSYQLASKCVDWKPDFIIALWRGGAPIGCAVHEFFKWCNLNVDHVAIRTSRYTGIGEASEQVQVHSLSYILDKLEPHHRVLLVDDVWDSGRTIEAVYAKFGNERRKQIRTACVYYKPKRNKLNYAPDYFVEETDEWLVFPHELEDMTLEEIETYRGTEVAKLLKKHKK